MPRYPVDNRIKTGQQIPFGGADPNAKYGRHAGDDSANGIGTPVHAPASGTVTGYTSSQYHGNVVEIRDGSLYPHVFHLKSRVVEPGQEVKEGQLIGYSGSTGLSTGPHIHFGVSKKSVPATTSFNDFIDPMEYIKSGGNEVNQQDFDNQVRANTLRQAVIDGSGKRLSPLLGYPAKDKDFSVDELNKIVDEVVIGWNFRQNMINDLQKQIDGSGTAEQKLAKIERIINEEK